MERTIKEILEEGLAYNTLNHLSGYFLWRMWLQLFKLKIIYIEQKPWF